MAKRHKLDSSSSNNNINNNRAVIMIADSLPEVNFLSSGQ